MARWFHSALRSADALASPLSTCVGRDSTRGDVSVDLLKWVLVSAFVLTTVTTIVWGWLDERIYMNGRLCAAHSDLEKSCKACHTPWKTARVTTAMCVSESCHPAILAETVHVPPEVLPPECHVCHTEHCGRKASLYLVEDDELCKECHEKEIGGSKHKFASNCHQCHYYHLPSPSAPPAERKYEDMRNPHGEHLELVSTLLQLEKGDAVCRHCHGMQRREGGVRFAGHGDCGGSECHQNIERTRPSKECKQCHTLSERTKETGIVFSHAAHTKEKIQVGCEECHIIKEPDRKFVKLNVQFCLDCHKVKHDTEKDIASKECAYCHAAVEPVKTACVRFDHQRHSANGCTECHKDFERASKLLLPEKMLTTAHCGICHTKTGLATP